MSESSESPVSTGTEVVAEREEPRPVFTPAVDIYDTEDGLVLQADLPGATHDGLDVQVEGNVLSITARAMPQAPAGSTLVHQEYVIGDYERSFILSDQIDHDKIRAELKDGVLTLTLPKAESALPRKVTVKQQ